MHVSNSDTQIASSTSGIQRSHIFYFHYHTLSIYQLNIVCELNTVILHFVKINILQHPLFDLEWTYFFCFVVAESVDWAEVVKFLSTQMYRNDLTTLIKESFHFPMPVKEHGQYLLQV